MTPELTSPSVTVNSSETAPSIAPKSLPRITLRPPDAERLMLDEPDRCRLQPLTQQERVLVDKCRALIGEPRQPQHSPDDLARDHALLRALRDMHLTLDDLERIERTARSQDIMRQIGATCFVTFASFAMASMISLLVSSLVGPLVSSVLKQQRQEQQPHDDASANATGAIVGNVVGTVAAWFWAAFMNAVAARFAASASLGPRHHTIDTGKLEPLPRNLQELKTFARKEGPFLSFTTAHLIGQEIMRICRLSPAASACLRFFDSMLAAGVTGTVHGHTSLGKELIPLQQALGRNADYRTQSEGKREIEALRLLSAKYATDGRHAVPASCTEAGAWLRQLGKALFTARHYNQAFATRLMLRKGTANFLALTPGFVLSILAASKGRAHPAANHVLAQSANAALIPGWNLRRPIEHGLEKHGILCPPPPEQLRTRDPEYGQQISLGDYRNWQKNHELSPAPTRPPTAASSSSAPNTNRQSPLNQQEDGNWAKDIWIMLDQQPGQAS